MDLPEVLTKLDTYLAHMDSPKGGAMSLASFNAFNEAAGVFVREHRAELERRPPVQPDERAWMEGNSAAWRRMLVTCLQELQMPGDSLESLTLWRSNMLTALRGICQRYGDNDWPDNLWPADIVEKHLERHLDEGRSLESGDG